MELEFRSPALAPGYRLDRYELLCPIAEGGMAQVWIARMRGKHGFERMVAVKTILPKYAAEPSFQKMLLDEARIASGIEHTNVTQTIDLGEQHGVLYLVMELVDGEALTKLLAAVSQRTKKMPFGIILRILADTCGGLHAAHELRNAEGANLGVVHRDVSPQNILVTTRGVAKLIDFGIAKAKDRLSGETSSGLVKGKIKYMAPEQALGRPLDRRVDVYAVAAILYRVIAGRPPFSGSNELETLHALTSGKPPPPLPPNVPPVIGSIALRGLAHDPARRFASAADMQAAMEQAMVEAGCPTTTYDVQEFVADHLLDKAAARKQTLELALTAARERERMAQLLKPPKSESSSGIMDVGSRVVAMGKKPAPVVAPPPALFAPPPPSRPSRPPDEDGDLTRPFVPPVAAPAPVPPFAPSMRPSIPSLPSRELMTEEVARPGRRSQLTIIVAAAVAGLAIVMLFAILLTRSGETQAHAVATLSFSRWAKTVKLPDPPPPASAAPIASVDSPYALAAATPTNAAPPPVAAPPPAPKAPPAPVGATPPAPKPTTAPPKKPRPDVDGF